MKELLEKVLTDASARDSATMPAAASNMAEQYVPWSGDEL